MMAPQKKFLNNLHYLLFYMNCLMSCYIFKGEEISILEIYLNANMLCSIIHSKIWKQSMPVDAE